MKDRGVPRVRQVVVVDEPIIAGDPYDYADAFEVRVQEPDLRSAEQFFRCAFEHGPWPVPAIALIAQRYLLRFRLGPRSSPDHIMGWRIVASQPDAIQLEAGSSVVHGVLVLRKLDPTCTVINTYVSYKQPSGRALWTIVSPLHRAVARYLMAHAAANAFQVDASDGAPTTPPAAGNSE